MLCAALVGLCGCPLGTPYDHYRPLGHGDTTIDIAPADDVIVFNAAGKGRRDLYLLELSSLKVTRIAETPEYETEPSFSPDGEWIVYSAGVPGERADHIFVMRRDGSSKTQLTDIDANDTSARFSPDGKTIVFARDKTYNWGGMAANWSGGGVICLMDADGANLRQLTADDEFACAPYFSADGTRIVYSRTNASTTDRISLSIEGSTKPQSIAGPSDAVSSHDDSLIAYSQGQFQPDLKIVVAAADGTSAHVVTPDMGYCWRPLFTHAGDKLLFLHFEWPNGPTGVSKSSVWQAAVDGTRTDKIADRTLFDDPLSWQSAETP